SLNIAFLMKDIASGKSMLFIPRLLADYAVWMGEIQPPSHFQEKYKITQVFYTDEIKEVLLDQYQATGAPLLFLLHGLNTDSNKYSKPAEFQGQKFKTILYGILFLLYKLLHSGIICFVGAFPVPALKVPIEVTVADLWSIHGWNLIFRKPLNDWEIKILVELLEVLEQFKDLSTAEDSLRGISWAMPWNIVDVLASWNREGANSSQKERRKGIEKFQTDLNTLHPILTECRVIKSNLELALIQYANDISSEAHVEPTSLWFSRAAKGVAPAIDRVKSAGVMQIHRPLPFSFG
ncbi:hypothetical protein MTR67_031215, partial [Solanum verrucosum]